MSCQIEYTQTTCRHLSMKWPLHLVRSSAKALARTELGASTSFDRDKHGRLNNSNLPSNVKFALQKIDKNHFSFPNSIGKFMPTLLADNRTRSSSSMPMPGLYLSNSVMYVLCARTYARYCSACATACSGPVSGRKCSRRRWCSGDGVLERIGRGGSSRRNER